MNTRIMVISILLIIFITFGISLAVRSQMPDQMASHWNAQGQVDGYSNQTTALFLVPGMEIGMALLFIAVPIIDPRRANIRRFRSVYNLFVVMSLGFMTYLHILTLAWNLHLITDLLLWMTPAFAILLYLSGVLVSKAQPNWFIGIRTPWTLSDDQVWEKTHRAGGVAFKVSACISLIGLIFPQAYLWLLMIPIMISAISLVVYSYIAYKKLHNV